MTASTGESFMRFVKANLLAASLAALASVAMAHTPVKIGMVTTLSGPGGYLGEDVRDGFQLAIDAEGGKLGGVPVVVTVEDDALKPGQGKQIAERYIKTENMKIVTGIIFSNVAGAVVPDVVDSGAFYFSPNSGLSNLAGKDCHQNYFVVSWQNDNLHESVGEVANNLKFKKVFIVAANYQAGRDAVAGFKRFYKGAVAGELYPRRRARRGLQVPARRPRHRLHQAVRPGGLEGEGAAGGLGRWRRLAHAEGAGRCRRRHLLLLVLE
jgi:branched-chain amino acid transport system substrate-binding protein